MTHGLLLNVRDAAALLGITERSLRARIARRVIPCKKLGARVLFEREGLVRWVHALPGVTPEEAQENLDRRSP